MLDPAAALPAWFRALGRPPRSISLLDRERKAARVEARQLRELCTGVEALTRAALAPTDAAAAELRGEIDRHLSRYGAGVARAVWQLLHILPPPPSSCRASAAVASAAQSPPPPPCRSMSLSGGGARSSSSTSAIEVRGATFLPRCPLSGLPVRIPCRLARACGHAQPLDFLTLVDTQLVPLLELARERLTAAGAGTRVAASAQELASHAHRRSLSPVTNDDADSIVAADAPLAALMGSGGDGGVVGRADSSGARRVFLEVSCPICGACSDAEFEAETTEYALWRLVEPRPGLRAPLRIEMDLPLWLLLRGAASCSVGATPVRLLADGACEFVARERDARGGIVDLASP